ncbi:MAG: hypothetical protein IJG87_03905 [Ruminococcus sp.]|nr:hypothetical protein [Ruminococcus sp.]
MSVEIKITDELIGFCCKKHDTQELLELNFWRRLMNCLCKEIVNVGGYYTVSEVVLAENTYNEIVAFIVEHGYSGGEDEIYLSHRHNDGETWTIVRATIKYSYCHDGGAYDGMKNGFTVFVRPGNDNHKFMNLWDDDEKLIRKGIEKVLTCEDFGLLSGIYF